MLQLVQSSEVRVVEGVPSLKELYSTEGSVCIATMSVLLASLVCVGYAVEV